MGEVLVPQGAKNFSVEAVVIRCTCPPGQGEIRHPGSSCPWGRHVDLGRIAYDDVNPFRRWAVQFKIWLRVILKIRPDLKGQ
jgi:hypothetical protein